LNIISGCKSEEAILQHYHTEARNIMSVAKFNLCSWASNSQQLQAITQTNHVLDSDTTVNLLGLKWNTCNDMIALAQWQHPHNKMWHTARASRQ